MAFLQLLRFILRFNHDRTWVLLPYVRWQISSKDFVLVRVIDFHRSSHGGTLWIRTTQEFPRVECVALTCYHPGYGFRTRLLHPEMGQKWCCTHWCMDWWSLWCCLLYRIYRQEYSRVSSLSSMALRCLLLNLSGSTFTNLF